MRFLRALIIGLLSIFPGTIVGYLGWLATGASNDNYSPGVVFFCNVIPFGFVLMGFIWSWKNGAEYAVNYQG
ncbi:MAG: hypothetical protein ACKVG2_00455 [Candidatus Poseidoniales archaeon]|jgi:ABC-type uncharacterized transport system permease subunit|tara:strand:- start:2916 stop:3131 length:216 start_codon:yes stop_codon:yes gene_type:complete